MLLMCFCIDNVLSRWTPRYLTDVLKGTLFLLCFLFCFCFCALTVVRLKTRCRANRHNLSLICVQLKLVAVHPEQNIINMSEYRIEQKGTDRIGHFWTAQCHRRTCDSHNYGQKSHLKKAEITSVQGKQDRSQHGTLGHAVYKRAGGRHNAINND